MGAVFGLRMRDFFAVRDARDPLYRFLATQSDRARRVQDLWERVEPFVDNRRPEAAAADFASAFWEMYAAAALLEAQVQLVPKQARRSLAGGPDIEASPTTWVEAILATPGTTEHRVVAPELNPLEARAVWMPDDKLLVRIQTAINTKRDKYVHYRKSWNRSRNGAVRYRRQWSFNTVRDGRYGSSTGCEGRVRYRRADGHHLHSHEYGSERRVSAPRVGGFRQERNSPRALLTRRICLR